MTVIQLIEELSKLPPQEVVMVTVCCESNELPEHIVNEPWMISRVVHYRHDAGHVDIIASNK